MVQRIARRWFLLSVAGISLYIALYAAFFGFEDIHIAGISAVLLSALGISIILALDDPHTQGNETAENIKDITFAGLAYILLVKRKPLLALLVKSTSWTEKTMNPPRGSGLSLVQRVTETMILGTKKRPSTTKITVIAPIRKQINKSRSYATVGWRKTIRKMTD